MPFSRGDPGGCCPCTCGAAGSPFGKAVGPLSDGGGWPGTTCLGRSRLPSGAGLAPFGASGGSVLAAGGAPGETGGLNDFFSGGGVPFSGGRGSFLAGGVGAFSAGGKICLAGGGGGAFAGGGGSLAEGGGGTALGKRRRSLSGGGGGSLLLAFRSRPLALLLFFLGQRWLALGRLRKLHRLRARGRLRKRSRDEWKENCACDSAQSASGHVAVPKLQTRAEWRSPHQNAL